MPIYEYQCETCGEVSEALQRMSDPPLTDCAKSQCDGALKRLISAPAVQFKGSGWYVTDYAGKGKKDGDGKGGDGNDKKGGESKSSSGGESSSKKDGGSSGSDKSSSGKSPGGEKKSA